MMVLTETEAVYAPTSPKHYTSAYCLQLIILSAEPEVKTRGFVIEVHAEMYFCYRGTVLFRNHNGRKNKMLFNPCSDYVLLYLHFSTPTAYLFASEQWLSGYELSIQIISHPGLPLIHKTFHFRHSAHQVPSNINHSIFAVSLVRQSICFPDSEDKPDMIGKNCECEKNKSF